mmetsp:Transcript_67140/g.160137  ORF Transcript_67140/g.160137 Transcript_67140/m.160137 type:complete len:1001 (+) Transcript_67140:245-3247(+)
MNRSNQRDAPGRQDYATIPELEGVHPRDVSEEKHAAEARAHAVLAARSASIFLWNFGGWLVQGARRRGEVIWRRGVGSVGQQTRRAPPKPPRRRGLPTTTKDNNPAVCGMNWSTLMLALGVIVILLMRASEVRVVIRLNAHSKPAELFARANKEFRDIHNISQVWGKVKRATHYDPRLGSGKRGNVTSHGRWKLYEGLFGGHDTDAAAHALEEKKATDKQKLQESLVAVVSPAESRSQLEAQHAASTLQDTRHAADKKKMDEAMARQFVESLDEAPAIAKKAASMPPVTKIVEVAECKHLANIMTTVMESEDELKILAQKNTLMGLSILRQHGVKPFLFTDSAVWARRGKDLGFTVIMEFDTSRDGIPVFKGLFRKLAIVSPCSKSSFIFDGYVNADILFTTGLIKTLLEVRRLWRAQVIKHERRLLLIGQRTNYAMDLTNVVKTEADIQEMARKGMLFTKLAEDYFIMSRGAVDWDKVPDFVIGRRAYDNWLVDHSYHDGIDIIDCTRTTLALHQTGADGNKAGHSKGDSTLYNLNLINPSTGEKVKKSEWDHGSTKFAIFFSRIRADRVLIIIPRTKRRVPEFSTTGWESGAATAGAPPPPASQLAIGDKPADQGDVAPFVPNAMGPVDAFASIQSAADAKPVVKRTIDPTSADSQFGVWDSCKVKLNLMTTFVDSELDPIRMLAQNNALAALKLLRPLGVRGVLFQPADSKWVQRAKDAGLNVVTNYEMSEGLSLPHVKAMGKYASEELGRCGDASHVVFDGFMNGDLAFSSNLVSTIDFLVKQWGEEIKTAERNVVIVGRRTDSVIFEEGAIKGFVVKTEDDIKELAGRGKLVGGDTQDYMLLSRGAFDWDEVPDLTFGRRYWDQYLVNYAYVSGLDLVDATEGITAVHQTRVLALVTSSNSDVNMKLLSPLSNQELTAEDLRHGDTRDAPFQITKLSESGMGVGGSGAALAVVPRSQDHRHKNPEHPIPLPEKPTPPGKRRRIVVLRNAGHADRR